ncbi:MAG: hypothetical protein KDD44_03070, partial [Bdellovibrionales bacterium]|nr:hypothetical protein [Bdellovibrionales bacterium]
MPEPVQPGRYRCTRMTDPAAILTKVLHLSDVRPPESLSVQVARAELPQVHVTSEFTAKVKAMPQAGLPASGTSEAVVLEVDDPSTGGSREVRALLSGAVEPGEVLRLRVTSVGDTVSLQAWRLQTATGAKEEEAVLARLRDALRAVGESRLKAVLDAAASMDSEAVPVGSNDAPLLESLTGRSSALQAMLRDPSALPERAREQIEEVIRIVLSSRISSVLDAVTGATSFLRDAGVPGLPPPELTAQLEALVGREAELLQSLRELSESSTKDASERTRSILQRRLPTPESAEEDAARRALSDEGKETVRSAASFRTPVEVFQKELSRLGATLQVQQGEQVVSVVPPADLVRQTGELLSTTASQLDIDRKLLRVVDMLLSKVPAPDNAAASQVTVQGLSTIERALSAIADDAATTVPASKGPSAVESRVEHVSMLVRHVKAIAETATPHPDGRVGSDATTREAPGAVEQRTRPVPPEPRQLEPGEHAFARAVAGQIGRMSEETASMLRSLFSDSPQLSARWLTLFLDREIATSAQREYSSPRDQALIRLFDSIRTRLSEAAEADPRREPSRIAQESHHDLIRFLAPSPLQDSEDSASRLSPELTRAARTVEHQLRRLASDGTAEQTAERSAAPPPPPPDLTTLGALYLRELRSVRAGVHAAVEVERRVVELLDGLHRALQARSTRGAEPEWYQQLAESFEDAVSRIERDAPSEPRAPEGATGAQSRSSAKSPTALAELDPEVREGLRTIVQQLKDLGAGETVGGDLLTRVDQLVQRLQRDSVGQSDFQKLLSDFQTNLARALSAENAAKAVSTVVEETQQQLLSFQLSIPREVGDMREPFRKALRFVEGSLERLAERAREFADPAPDPVPARQETAGSLLRQLTAKLDDLAHRVSLVPRERARAVVEQTTRDFIASLGREIGRAGGRGGIEQAVRQESTISPTELRDAVRQALGEV